MKPKTVGYSETFQIGLSSNFQKIWHEVELDESDDPRQCLYHCKKVVQSFFFESNKAAEKERDIQVSRKPQSLIDDIRSCQELKVLETYKFIIKGKPEMEEAYKEMEEKLKK